MGAPLLMGAPPLGLRLGRGLRLRPFPVLLPPSALPQPEPHGLSELTCSLNGGQQVTVPEVAALAPTSRTAFSRLPKRLRFQLRRICCRGIDTHLFNKPSLPRSPCLESFPVTWPFQSLLSSCSQGRVKRARPRQHSPRSCSRPASGQGVTLSPRMCM